MDLIDLMEQRQEEEFTKTEPVFNGYKKQFTIGCEATYFDEFRGLKFELAEIYYMDANSSRFTKDSHKINEWKLVLWLQNTGKDYYFDVFTGSFEEIQKLTHQDKNSNFKIEIRNKINGLIKNY
jgi:hypothetical protein